MTPALRVLGLAMLLAVAPLARAEDDPPPSAPPVAPAPSAPAPAAPAAEPVEDLDAFRQDLKGAGLELESAQLLRGLLREQGRDTEVAGVAAVVLEYEEKVLAIQERILRVARARIENEPAEARATRAEAVAAIERAVADTKQAQARRDDASFTAGIERVARWARRLPSSSDAGGTESDAGAREVDTFLARYADAAGRLAAARWELEQAVASGDEAAQEAARVRVVAATQDAARIGGFVAVVGSAERSGTRTRVWSLPVERRATSRTAAGCDLGQADEEDVGAALARVAQVEEQLESAKARLARAQCVRPRPTEAETLRSSLTQLARELETARVGRESALARGDGPGAEELARKMQDLTARSGEIALRYRYLERTPAKAESSADSETRRRARRQAAAILRAAGLVEQADALERTEDPAPQPKATSLGDLADQITDLRDQVLQLRELLEERTK